ncbi:hypothetical protein [Pseudoxanthomonas sp. USHLN014]|uniref:hypothetical protein n=1 Tax=Pseudoxanthomonas sp. USHLN014 TaxID=3081297 RepID=UPI00301D85A1
MTAAEREIVRKAMDDSMTDEEAIELIVDVAGLLGELVKIAKPADQLEMLRTSIRFGNLADYAARRFALAVIATRAGKGGGA